MLINKYIYLLIPARFCYIFNYIFKTISIIMGCGNVDNFQIHIILWLKILNIHYLDFLF